MKITMQVKIDNNISEEKELNIKDYRKLIRLHLKNKREKETKQLKDYNEIKYKLENIEVIYKLYKEQK